MKQNNNVFKIITRIGFDVNCTKINYEYNKRYSGI